MNTRTQFLTSLSIAALVCVPLHAQGDEAATPPGETSSQAGESNDGDGGGDPSLDDLLKIESDETQRAHETAQEQRDAELERALLEKRIEDNFQQALAQMHTSAELLSEKFDAGLGTQRVQEEILKKLDDLINSARQQQSSSSSSSSQQQQQQQQQQARPQQQQDSQNQQNQNGNEAMQNEATTVQSPPNDAADISALLDETRIEWGNLPARQREQLLQAMKDRPSILYKRLTSDYYRRLAESD